MHEELPTQAADETVTGGPPAVGEKMSPLPDRQFGSARLIHRIRSGGMGEVWLARHRLLGREVAIKFLLASAINREDPAFQTFIQGAKVAASVEHPALNRILHADVADGVPFLVLEFLDGENLAELIARIGPLPPAVVRAVLEPVCDAVAALHHRDLIHRDIKPSNIMLTIEGRVVLTDFGLSRVGPASALRSNSGGVAGTPAYMAPEMFDGTVSARTDVYALGMTAYHLLCGKPAFIGSLAELQLQHRTASLDIQPLRSAGVSDEVIDVIVRATSKDLLFRPKTARHLLENFRSAFNAAGIQPASRESLILLVIGQAVKDSDSSTSKATNGEPPKTLAEFAAKKREQREASPPQIHSRAESDRPLNTAEKRQLRYHRIRIGIALVFASAAGAGVFVQILQLSDGRLQGAIAWMMNHLLRMHVQTVFVGGFYLDKTPWPTKVVADSPGFLLAIVPVMCGGLYWLARGKVKPLYAGKTICGWCRHELRGISTPRCSECGHRIGDRGPDENGTLPRGRRRRRWFLRLLLLPVIFFLAACTAYMLMRIFFPAGFTAYYSRVYFLEIFVIGFSALFPSLLVYEMYLQSDHRRSGRAWCRECRHELRDLVEPICPACGERI